MKRDNKKKGIKKERLAERKRERIKTKLYFCERKTEKKRKNIRKKKDHKTER